MIDCSMTGFTRTICIMMSNIRYFLNSRTNYISNLCTKWLARVIDYVLVEELREVRKKWYIGSRKLNRKHEDIKKCNQK